MGYHIVPHLFVHSDSKSCSPIGALWLTNMEKQVPREYQKIYMDSFDMSCNRVFQNRFGYTDKLRNNITIAHMHGRNDRGKYL